jgi:hypothetical protein
MRLSTSISLFVNRTARCGLSIRVITGIFVNRYSLFECSNQASLACTSCKELLLRLSAQFHYTLTELLLLSFEEFRFKDPFTLVKALGILSVILLGIYIYLANLLCMPPFGTILRNGSGSKPSVGPVASSALFRGQPSAGGGSVQEEIAIDQTKGGQ